METNEKLRDFQERLMAEAGLKYHVKHDEILSIVSELGHGKFTTQVARERKFRNAIERVKAVMGPITKHIESTRQVVLDDDEYSEDFLSKYPDHRVTGKITYVDADFNAVRTFRLYAVSREDMMKQLEVKYPEKRTFIA